MDNNKKERGFITIAIGDYYRYLAKMLAITYRLNSNSKLQFAIVTDKSDEELEKLFDIIIIEPEKLADGYLYKLKLNVYSPFMETIFLDADQFVIDDLNGYWEFFKDCDFGVIGKNKNIENVGIVDAEKVKKDFNVTVVPMFNGGVYYFKDTEKAKKVFDDALMLIDKYDYYGMPKFINAGVKKLSKGDEPLFVLAMAINSCFAVRDVWHRTNFHVNKSKALELDVIKKKCTFIKKYWGRVYPTIIHFGTDNTKLYHYKKEAFKIKLCWNYNMSSLISNTLIFPYTLWYISKSILWQSLFYFKNRNMELFPVKDPTFNAFKKLKKRFRD